MGHNDMLTPPLLNHVPSGFWGIKNTSQIVLASPDLSCDMPETLAKVLFCVPRI